MLSVLRFALLLLLACSLAVWAEPAATQPEQNNDNPAPSRLQQLGEQTAELASKISHRFLDATRFLPIARSGNEGQDGIPVRIAIIPPTGYGTALEREDIWFAVTNALSAKPFQILRPFELERQLATIDQSIDGQWTSLTAAELAKRLQVDGLIFIDIPHLDKLYIAAYAHYELSIELSFYDAQQDLIIWRKLEKTAEREGGLSLNPLGILTTALSSAQVLNEATRQALVDRLARRFEQQIPFPKVSLNHVTPPQVELAFSNHLDGPFRAGEEALVFLKAEPGLIATFDLGNIQQGLVLTETSDGEYLGRYVVADGDNGRDLVIRLYLQRPRDRARVDWRLPGRITLDTTAPVALATLTASPNANGIRLIWQPHELTENVSYIIEKADESGRYSQMATVNVREWLDTDTISDRRHFYRVTVQDEAGNLSAATEIAQTAIRPGPTLVNADIDSDTTWYAFGGPYIIQRPIKVLRGATLTIEHGTIVAVEHPFEILGRLHSAGQAGAPVLFSGEGSLAFLHTGNNEHLLQHSHFQQLQHITLRNAHLRYEYGRLTHVKEGIHLADGSQLSAAHLLFSHNETALRVDNSALQLQHSTLQQNKLGLQLHDPLALQLTENKFSQNSQHILSNQPVLLQGVLLDEPDFDTLLTKLGPAVRIDWQSVAPEHNLLSKWLEQQWQAVIAALGQQNFDLAFQISQQVVQHLPDRPRLAELSQLLGRYTGQQSNVNSQSPALQVLQRQIAANRNTTFYLQHERIPYSAAVLESDSLLLSQADSRLNASYLRQQFPDLTPAQITQLRSQLDLPQTKLASVPLTANRDGLFIHSVILHLFDENTLNRRLAALGLTSREPSKMLLGVLKNGSDHGLERRLNLGLQQHGFRLLDAGQGSLNKQTQQKMQQMGAHLGLELKVTVDEAVSNLNSNLKLITLNVDLTLLPLSGKDSARFVNISKNTANFQVNQAIASLINDIYPEIENALLPWMMEAETKLAVQP